jgi:MFS family permease
MHLPPRWVVAVSLAVAAAILGDSLLYAVLPTGYEQLGLEVGMVGVLLSANRFVRLLSNPLAGWVVARLGAHRPFVVAVFAGAATTAAYALGIGFAGLLVARALWGVCWSFLRLGGYLAALEAADDGNRGYYLGFFNGVTRFGSFVAVLTGGLLTDLLGMHATIYGFAALNLLGAVALLRERPPAPALRLVADPPRTNRDERDGTTPSPGESAPAEPPDPGLRWRLAAVYAAVFVHGLAISGLVTATLGLWLRTLYGTRVAIVALPVGVATLTGVLLGARFLADVLWGPVAGHLSDRYGRRAFALGAGGLEALALVALSLGLGLAWTVGAALLLFVAATALQAALDATAGDLAPPARRSRTMSWYATWLDLGAAAGPLLGYLAAAGLGLDWRYRGAAILLLAVGLAYAPLLGAAPRRRRAVEMARPG